MFISTKEDLKSGDYVTVLGKVSKFESPLLYIQTKTSEIPIQYKTIHPYSTEYVCVSGTVSNNKIVIEESVEPLNSNFDVNNFDDFVKAAKRFPDIF